MNAISRARVDREESESLKQAGDPNVVGRLEAQFDMAIDQPDAEILLVPRAEVSRNGIGDDVFDGGREPLGLEPNSGNIETALADKFSG